MNHNGKRTIIKKQATLIDLDILFSKFLKLLSKFDFYIFFDIFKIYESCPGLILQERSRIF